MSHSANSPFPVHKFQAIGSNSQNGADQPLSPFTHQKGMAVPLNKPQQMFNWADAANLQQNKAAGPMPDGGKSTFSKKAQESSPSFAKSSPDLPKISQGSGNKESQASLKRKRLPAISAAAEPEPAEDEPEQQVIEGFGDY